MRLVVCLTLLLALSSPLYGQEPVGLGDEALPSRSLFTGGQKLFETARFHPGDDPAWAAPDFDDRSWISVNTRLEPDATRQDAWTGIGWFRIPVLVERTVDTNGVGLLIDHLGASEVYLDGRLLFHTGTVGTTRATTQPRRDFTPNEVLLGPGRHLLAVRYAVYDLEEIYRFTPVAGFELWVGDWTVMDARSRLLHLQQGLLTGIFLAFTLLHGLLFFFYPRLKANGYFALFTLLISFHIFLYLNYDVWTTQGAYLTSLRLFFGLSPLGLVALLLFAYDLLDGKLPWPFFLLCVVALVVALLGVIQGLNAAPWFAGFTLLALLETGRTTFIAIRRNRKWAIILGLGILPLIVTAIYESLHTLDLVQTPWFGSHVPVFYYAALSVTLSMSIFMARTFAQTHRDLAESLIKLEAYSKSLEDKVSARTHDLKQKNEALQTALEDLHAAQDRLIQAEKMASLGQLTAGIAHEIKNPLNFVNNFSALTAKLVDELQEGLEEEGQRPKAGSLLAEIMADLKANALRIHEHGQRADGIVSAMMRHANPPTGERSSIAVNAFVREYVQLAFHSMKARSPDLEVEINTDLEEAVGSVVLNPQEMGRVLMNVLDNAFQAVHDRSKQGDSSYTPTVSVWTRRTDEHVAIAVTDNGPGIPVALRQKIFEPFFTTRPTGSGTGLGLSLSYDIVVRGHGGVLLLEDAAGKGATFTIQLPC